VRSVINRLDCRRGCSSVRTAPLLVRWLWRWPSTRRRVSPTVWFAGIPAVVPRGTPRYKTYTACIPVLSYCSIFCWLNINHIPSYLVAACIRATMPVDRTGRTYCAAYHSAPGSFLPTHAFSSPHTYTLLCPRAPRARLFDICYFQAAPRASRHACLLPSRFVHSELVSCLHAATRAAFTTYIVPAFSYTLSTCGLSL